MFELRLSVAFYVKIIYGTSKEYNLLNKTCHNCVVIVNDHLV